MVLYGKRIYKIIEIRMKVALITSNVGDFDIINKIPPQSFPFDYHLYDENNLPTNLGVSNRLLSKYPKLLTHCLLPDYDVYIWIDGSIKITSEHFIAEIIKDLRDVKMAAHPERLTVKQELKFIIQYLKKGDPYLKNRYELENIEKMSKLIESDLPLYACGIFARRNNKKVNSAFEKIWDLCKVYGNLDQVLYSYIEKEHGLQFDKFYTYPNKYYKVNAHRSDIVVNKDTPLNHIEIINLLIEKHKFNSYLEIGIENGICFNSIKIKDKIGIDPNPECSKNIRSGKFLAITSDNFFAQNIKTFDIIFIDGLHYAEQVLKDVDNALKCLNDEGVIVVHDCNPTDEQMQIVPRQQGIWTGDVWKAWVKLRQLPSLEMFVLDTDYGCGIIRHGHQVPLNNVNLTWSEFVKNRAEWLNLKEPNYIIQCYALCLLMGYKLIYIQDIIGFHGEK